MATLFLLQAASKHGQFPGVASSAFSQPIFSINFYLCFIRARGNNLGSSENWLCEFRPHRDIINTIWAGWSHCGIWRWETPNCCLKLSRDENYRFCDPNGWVGSTHFHLLSYRKVIHGGFLAWHSSNRQVTTAVAHFPYATFRQHHYKKSVSLSATILTQRIYGHIHIYQQ